MRGQERLLVTVPGVRLAVQQPVYCPPNRVSVLIHDLRPIDQNADSTEGRGLSTHLIDRSDGFLTRSDTFSRDCEEMSRIQQVVCILGHVEK